MTSDTDGPLGFDPDPEDAPRAARRPDPVGERPAAPGSEPGAADGPARRSGGASQYGWFIGVVGILLVVVVTLSTLRSEGPGSRGIAGGEAAPPFAAPLATSPLAAAERNDVNVAVRGDQGDAGRVPACSVRRPDVLNLCALYERGPVVLAFFATRSAECVEQLDRLDDVARRHPRVGFAAVSIRGDLGDVREIVRTRRWSFPVGFDDDGILANAYGVAVCPLITFVRRGGRVAGTSLGAVGAADLEARVRRLERG